MQIQRAFSFPGRSHRYTMGIDHGGLQTGMAQQRLYGTNIVISLQQVCREGVTEGVGGDLLGYFCLADGMVERALKLRLVKVVTAPLAGFF